MQRGAYVPPQTRSIIWCKKERIRPLLYKHKSNCTVDIENLTLDLLFALRNTPTSRYLPSNTSHGTLQHDLRTLISAVASETFEFARISPLLYAVVARKPEIDIWDCVYSAVMEPTPPPRPTVSSLEQTPWLHKTSSFANSSECRQDIDRVLKSELGPLYIGFQDFRLIFLGGIDGLEAASDAVFKRCTEGTDDMPGRSWRHRILVVLYWASPCVDLS